jgi:riboflavin synthase
MFTGIIQQTGLFRGFRGGKTEMEIEAPGLAGRVDIGGSVAVDGVCLSVVRRDGPRLVFNLSKETLARTTLGSLRVEARLNLELPLTLADPVGGHLMSGHIDFVTKVTRVVPKRPGLRLIFALPAAQRPFFIPQGSVGINGVSLTVAAISPASFETELIPVTLDKSSLSHPRAGDAVNVECDMIGKYVYNWMTPKALR